MTPKVGEPFVLMIKGYNDGGDSYCFALVEEVRNGKIVAVRMPGPVIYRTGLDDKAIRFQSDRVQNAVARLVEKTHPRTNIWFDRDQIMVELMEEVMAQ